MCRNDLHGGAITLFVAQGSTRDRALMQPQLARWYRMLLLVTQRHGCKNGCSYTDQA